MTKARAFLNHLFSGVDGFCELTYIAPAHTDLYPPVFTDSYKIGEDRIDFERVAAFNARGYGVYVGTTTKRSRPAPGHRATEADALWTPALWAEIDLKAGDYATLDAMHRAILQLTPRATTIVFSGGGLHVYWRIAPVLVTRDTYTPLKRTLRGLALAIKGDPAVAELARVMRLVGTTNTKAGRDNAVCTIIHHLPNTAYTLSDFSPYAALATPPPRDPVRPATLPPATIPGYLKWFLTTHHPDGTRNNALNWTAYKMRCDGFSVLDAEAWLLPRAVACGLGERESRATIRSPWK